MKIRLSLLLAAALAFTSFGSGLTARTADKAIGSSLGETSDAERTTRLEHTLDDIRQQLKIPAMSCAIVKDQKVVWARGLGYADVENKIPATEHTSYHLASLTKTFASTILMQLVQDGKLKLDDPISKYGILLESEGVIRVKHLFSHTSEGNPGEQYSYNGNRFAELDKLIQKASGESFAELLIANILDPLDLKETAPNVWPVVQTKSPSQTDHKSEEEVKAAVMNLLDAINSSNVDQIERYLTPQQNAFRRDGGLLAQFLEVSALREDFRAGVKVKIDVSDLETAVYGNTALATCILSQAVTLPGGRVRNDGPLRTSMVWNKQDEAWKLVHAC